MKLSDLLYLDSRFDI